MTTHELPRIVVVGASGHAKVVLDVLEREGRFAVAGLLDAAKPVGAEWFGYRILGDVPDLPRLAGELSLAGGLVAIGDNWTRHRVVERIAQAVPGFAFVSAVHPRAAIARGASVGAGSVVMAGAVINSDARVAEHCIVNTRASLDHDSVLERFASLAPGVTTGGDVAIGAWAAISIGATILHGRRVGEHAVVGAGALVHADVPAYRVAYGVPARVIRERAAGDRYL